MKTSKELHWDDRVFAALSDGVGLVEIDDHAKIEVLASNTAFDRLKRRKHLSTSLPDPCKPDFDALIARVCERCAQSGSPAFDKFEIQNGGPEVFEVTAIPHESDSRGARCISVIVHEVTTENSLRAALYARSEAFHALVDHAPDCICRYDTQGRILYINPAVERMGPTSLAQVRGKTSIEVSPGSSSARRFHDCILEVARTGVPAEIEAHIDAFGPATPAWHQVLFVAERDERNNIAAVLGVGRDITSQRRLERALLEAANREQQRLGSEIHDGLGQELTGLAMFLTALANGARRGKPPTAESLDQVLDIAVSAIASCRDIARGLAPVDEARGGLVQALRDMVAFQRDSFKTDVQLEVDQGVPMRLPPDAIDHLYRIAQEGVINARKYANATCIRVALVTQPDRVHLDIVDNGIGPLATNAASNGLGVRTMRYRASLIGAELSIDSGQGGGTHVVCECPQPA
ncbi:MAG TPA: PAS domain-containing protein [Steroidobacteraceae bacterium]|nr:PAS domain-containing protein [Steroidobacteraceae bacterium]